MKLYGEPSRGNLLEDGKVESPWRGKLLEDGKVENLGGGNLWRGKPSRADLEVRHLQGYYVQGISFLQRCVYTYYCMSSKESEKRAPRFHANIQKGKSILQNA